MAITLRTDRHSRRDEDLTSWISTDRLRLELRAVLVDVQEAIRDVEAARTRTRHAVGSLRVAVSGSLNPYPLGAVERWVDADSCAMAALARLHEGAGHANGYLRHIDG